jgi:hypothetical protein
MINLMPYDLKTQTKAARFNFILVGYTFISLFSFALLSLASVGAYYIVTTDTTQTNTTMTDTQIANIQQQADSFRQNLNDDLFILNRSYSNSQSLTEFAKVLPTGTRIKSLSVSPNIYSAPTEVRVLALTENLETQLKSNIQKSSKVTGYQLVGVYSNTDKASKYKFVITANIMMVKARN